MNPSQVVTVSGLLMPSAFVWVIFLVPQVLLSVV